MNDKISVIVPVYKVEDYLDRCVESIVRQTYSNLEIILVDDGSPDSCPLKCDEWAKRDTRIKVIHKENGGLSSARNSALDIITGNYIIFVDSDDSINLSMIEILHDIIVKESSDISMCGYKKVGDKSATRDKKYVLDYADVQSYIGEDIFALLYNKKISLITTAWAKLYKKEIFESIRYPEGIIHEDEKVILEILSKCKIMSYIPYPMYNYTQRRDSIMAVKFSHKRLVLLDILKERINQVEEYCPQFTDDAIIHFMKTSIYLYYDAKRTKMTSDILLAIKKPIIDYYKAGYSNRFIKMFFSHPKLLDFLLKIRRIEITIYKKLRRF